MEQKTQYNVYKSKKHHFRYRLIMAKFTPLKLYYVEFFYR